MSGNAARRRMLKFMPSEFKLIETRQPPLKDLYDEWLARVICYAFSVPATPFVAQVNRATSETMRLQATQEGLVPLKTWIKNALDQVIQVCMGEPNLEFVWVGDDAVDPLQQAQTLQILVSAGIKTRDEARAELGLGGDGAKAGLGKYNQNHDERGRFTTADDASDVVGNPARQPRPKGVQVASLDNLASDAPVDDSGASAGSVPGGGDDDAQVAQAGQPLGTSKYSVDLRAEEALWGGHAVRDHVGKSPDDLVAEQEANRVDTPVEGGVETEYRLSESSYPSWESANDYVNRLLEFAPRRGRLCGQRPMGPRVDRRTSWLSNGHRGNRK